MDNDWENNESENKIDENDKKKNKKGKKWKKKNKRRQEQEEEEKRKQEEEKRKQEEEKKNKEEKEDEKTNEEKEDEQKNENQEENNDNATKEEQTTQNENKDEDIKTDSTNENNINNKNENNINTNSDNKENINNDDNNEKDKNSQNEENNNDNNINENNENTNTENPTENIIDTSTKQTEKTNSENDSENEEESPKDEISIMIQRLKKTKKNGKCYEIKFTENEIKDIIDKVSPILEKEPSLLHITSPIYICGDIHGQFYDLLTLFEIFSTPQKKKFLFLGDYVDRGKQSLECLLLLLCFKIKYPNNIFLLRGNHESEPINKQYGFFDECRRRLSIRIYKYISTNIFNLLPITAIIENKILCMHGGLAKNLEKLYQLEQIKRPTEIPDEGILCDLVWSDPCNELSKKFGDNERGVSVTFSKKVVEEFCENNDLDLICRAHQVVEEGYQFFAEMKLVTIFTAPNYCGEFDNNGGILEVNEDLLCKIHVLRPSIEQRGKKKKKIMGFVN